MYTFYVSLDDDGYASSTPATEAADDLTAITLYTSTDKEQFLRHYTKYRHDENGNWISPDNLPSLQVSSLLRSIQDQGQIIADQKGTITDLQADLTAAQSDATKAKADAAAATVENATLKANDSLHDSAIMELSDLLFSQLQPTSNAGDAATAATSGASSAASSAAQS